MSAFVSVHQLTKHYGAKIALHGISFEIQRGEIFGLLGPNGAGKTSLLECLAGLREPNGGTITIAGIDAHSQPRELKARLGVMLQATELQDKITAREALTLYGSFYRQALPVDSLLTRFSLTEKADAPFRSLSGGQRQRLGLALAFVNNPEFILLDEPTAGLDPATRHALHADILRWREEGKTILLSTHYLEEAERLCDRVAIINQGRVLATGTPRELLNRQSGPLMVRLVTNPALPAEALATLPGFVQPTPVGSTEFRTHNPDATLAAIPALLQQHHAKLVELQIKADNLENFFLQLTTDQNSPVP